MSAATELARPGRIGPNAIVRVGEALERRLGAALAADVFARAGLSQYLLVPPQAMVDEAEARRLHAALRERLGSTWAARVSRAAGEATADYLLARRIPKPVQALLCMLPAPLACRVLLGAISRHAWTFAGSGRFAATPGPPAHLTISGNPLCMGLSSDEPVCGFYAATFERLFRALVHRDARVTEISCEAQGDMACVFEIRWC